MKNIREEDNIKDKERLKVTCIERKYRIDKPDLSFTITANKELDEDTTSNLLHEDMELKTFLSNYEITDIISSGTDVIKKPIIVVNNAKDSIIEIAEETREEIRDDTREEIRDDTREQIRDDTREQIIDKKEIKQIFTTNLGRQNKKRTFHPQTHTTSERRALFDYLNLPKQFTCRNYIDALGEKGAKVTNTAMPYDDLKYFERIGKVEKTKKTISGVMVWEIISQDKRVDVENIEEVGKREERRDIPMFI